MIISVHIRRPLRFWLRAAGNDDFALVCSVLNERFAVEDISSDALFEAARSYLKQRFTAAISNPRPDMFIHLLKEFDSLGTKVASSSDGVSRTLNLDVDIQIDGALGCAGRN